ncbi:hypothetical protein STHAL_32160 [Streptomyces halstedii]|uniref:MmyB-like transcription regulator ligand binding domain-containing protein n=1 Tax=Streptomyces halstedii TaxID=1944 RepID=A0ABS6U0N2_STRHA|nr:hypothetical protein [Streptomyces halstedii]MBV7674103.1 hypothetical protein [Streptomyces halstedii]
MIRRMLRRCATRPGTTLAPEDQAAVDAFRATLAALRTPKPWTPGRACDVAVRVGPFVERAQTRPGDDHGPDIIAVALEHPGGPHAPYGSRYRKLGWLRCETAKILGVWDPAYAPLTHAAADLDLPDDVGMEPAHCALYIEARNRDNSRDGYTLLRLGPYTQTRHAQQDYDRLTTVLDGRETTLVSGYRISARYGPLNVSDHQLFIHPYQADVLALLTDAVDG